MLKAVPMASTLAVLQAWPVFAVYGRQGADDMAFTVGTRAAGGPARMLTLRRQVHRMQKARALEGDQGQHEPDG